MANIEKPIWSKDKQTLSNVLIRNRLETYNVTDTWYDGTPMDDTKVDDDLVYIKYEGEYLVRNMEEGQVLQKDTMDEMRNLSTLETLLLKMGIYKHVQLNGYYEKGDTPEPINYKISDTVEDDDGGSVIETNLGDKLEHNFEGRSVNIKYFGAKGDEDKDDTEAIQIAADYCYKIGKVSTLSTNIELIFPVNNIYKITDTVTIKTGINVSMDGRVKYYGTMDRPAIVIGEPRIANRGANLKLNVNTIRSESLWDNENFVGVRLINSNQCKIDVKLLDGFYKGLHCLGLGQGFAYNQVNIRVFSSNKYGVYLDYEEYEGVSGWSNENIFYGGRFSTQSNFNSGKTRYGARITGDDNRFLYPSFELDRTTSSPAHSMCAIFEDAIECKIIHCRNEGNSSVNSDGGYAFILEGDSIHNYIEAAYSYKSSRSREINAFLDNSNSKQNQYVSVANKYTDLHFGQVVYNSGYLPSKWVNTDSNVGHCHGVMFLSLEGELSDFTPDNRPHKKYRAKNEGEFVELSRTAFAVEINTSIAKKFGVLRDGRYGHNGAVGIKFYNEDGEEITDEEESYIDKQREDLSIQQIFNYSSSYGGCWITSTPAPNDVPVYFSVKEEVKKIILFIGAPTNITRLKQFKILNLDNTHKGIAIKGSSTVSSDGLRRVYSDSPPTYGTYYQGEVLYTRLNARGGTFAFQCYTTGTSSPINASGTVLDSLTIEDIDSSNISTIMSGDRITVNSQNNVVDSVNTGNNTITVRNNLNLSSGTSVSINNREPEWMKIGLKDLNFSSGNIPEGDLYAVSGSLLQGVGSNMADHPLWVKTTDSSSNTGWKKVILEEGIESVDEITTSDASDESSTQLLVNELKAKVNELLLAMKDSGQMED